MAKFLNPEINIVHQMRNNERNSRSNLSFYLQ